MDTETTKQGNLSGNATLSRQPDIEELISRFETLFQVPTTLPPYRSVDHRIHLYPNTKPVNVRPYRYPHYQKGEMEKLVNEMLSQGIIRVSHSPFSSPVLLVKKKDGSYRFCVDYRALNEATVKDKFPIPTADEMFDELGGAVIFTKLDLRAGYHQIRVHDRDVYKTAFRTHDGHYEFLDHEFYVKKSKCVFGTDSLEYLGHIISGRGVEVDPKKVSAVSGWPVPTSQRQGLPDFEDTFVIEADASDVGIGAVLLQKEQPLGYFSRKLGPRMKVAATYQKELFAIVEAVYKWRQYLIGRRFIIRTDHRIIKELMQQVIQTPLQQKYVRKLMGFDFGIEYKSGASNLVADALSRLQEDDDEVTSAFMALSRPVVGLLEELKRENETLDELCQLHRRLDQGESLEGFQREQGLLLFRGKYFIGVESKSKDLLLFEFHVTPSAAHEGVQKDASCGTQLNHSTAYHPQTDGQTEVVNRGLEQYLRAMVSDRPHHWVRLLPWAEYSYNTSFHCSIKMTPFQALYGCIPPAIIPYPPGSSKVAAIDELLVERDVLLRQLRQNLFAARNRMELQANRSRREVEFNIGDKVLVKLQPYRQVTLAKRLSNKLSKRYYGPYEVLERVGKVAYRLDLPAESRIHLVFHVLLLKPFAGTVNEGIANLPEEVHEGQPMEQPLAVCASRVVLRNEAPTRQILVQWLGSPPEEATWEWLSEFEATYPSHHIEGNVISEGEENVTTQGVGRPKRAKSKPTWQKDYVM
ncbi:reverse transcriptase [Tanacetum coccineum]